MSADAQNSRENIRRGIFYCCIAGLLWMICSGVVVVANPSGDVLQLGAIYALGSAVFYACGNISVRRMVRFDHPVAITFYTQLFGMVLTGIAMPFVWVTPSWADFAGLMLLGLGGGIAQFWNTLSMRYAPVSVIGPFIYTQMIWAIIIDYLFWSDLPSVTLLIGVAIIVASSLSMLYRHARKTRVATA